MRLKSVYLCLFVGYLLISPLSLFAEVKFVICRSKTDGSVLVKAKCKKSEARVKSLDIPASIQGVQGLQGPAGPVGSQGPMGLTGLQGPAGPSYILGFATIYPMNGSVQKVLNFGGQGTTSVSAMRLGNNQGFYFVTFEGDYPILNSASNEENEKKITVIVTPRVTGLSGVVAHVGAIVTEGQKKIVFSVMTRWLESPDVLTDKEFSVLILGNSP